MQLDFRLMRPSCLPALVALSVSLPAAAQIHTAALEVGAGNQVQLLRASVQQKRGKPMWQSNGTHLAVHVDYSFAYWRATSYRNMRGAHQHIADVGITPVLRFQRDDARGWYVEGGIGAHLLSQRYDNRHKQLSTHFQFGDHLGVGYVFHNGWDATVKVQHFSNGGIKRPNSGENFLVLGLARPF